MHKVQRHKLNKLQSYSLPSNQYINLTLGASDSTYTAPTNGYFMCMLKSTGSNQILDMITQDSIQTVVYSSATNQYITQFVPIKKGSYVKVRYNSSIAETFFKFIYAVGSAPQT
jgi:hypothetical protein